MPRGFVLQPTYRLEDGRPVTYLYGVLETGEPFLARHDRTSPRFYVLHRDVSRLNEFGVTPAPETMPRFTMAGDPVLRVELRLPSMVPPLRDRLHAAGIRTYEADVRFALRLLMDHGVQGACSLEGPSELDTYGVRRFENPQLAPCTFRPDLRVLSLDIETDPKASRLLSIAISGCGVSEVLLFTPPGYASVAGAQSFSTERELLIAFDQRVRALDPDVLTGWNVVDFDLDVLARIATRLGVPLGLGRGPEPLRLRTQRGASGKIATIEGRVVLDGIALLRGAFVRMESYALDAVASKLLGKGKTFHDNEDGKGILRLFTDDRPRLVEYNRTDAELVLEILDHLHLIPLTVQRSLLTGMPPDRVSSSVASFDFLYLSELHRRRLVAPTTRTEESLDAGTGGHVLEPRAGLHRTVALFDFKSLYPSLMRTFHIDPLGRQRPGDNPILAPNGAAFSREPGILPALLDALMPQREAAKQAGDAVASQAIKILMNSFYGVLGTSACRFAHPELANAITGFGKMMLLWTRDRFAAEQLDVLYGDTDSVFVALPERDPQAAAMRARTLAGQFTVELADHIRETWNVESRLELEFEKLYLRLMLPSLRGGGGGARKRYAGLVYTGAGREPRLEFVGLETVRRDWTDLARGLQRELYRLAFADQPVDALLHDTVAALRQGTRDSSLVYHKTLRRNIASYTASLPPHVAAAKKRSGGGRLVSYVITVHGPEPVEALRSPIDYEHYVQKQIRPVAEPVLSLLGLNFDRVVGDDRQTTLFPDWIS